MQLTLMSQRVLYPPPQAVPLLPHGRRLGFVQPRSELLMKKGSGGCNEAKPSFTERGGTTLVVGDSRRVLLIGKTVQRSAQLIGSTVARMGASMQGTLMSQRVLYPPPQAVPLLPHGRRLRAEQPRSELLMKKGSGWCNEAKPSFPERGGTASAVGDSRRV